MIKNEFSLTIYAEFFFSKISLKFSTQTHQ